MSAEDPGKWFADTFASHETARVHDARGNLTFDGVYYFKHDYKNRLCEVYRCGTLTSDDFESSGNSEGWLKSSPTGSPGSQIATYSYDAVNRRIRKVVENSGSLDTDQHVYYDGWRCVEERVVTSGESWSEALAAQYLWGGLFSFSLG